MKNIFYLILLATLTWSCATKAPLQDPTPVHLSFNLPSKQVNETRVINVWTPPTYETSNETYPVLYMADGGIKEDFPHIANTLAKLINSKSIPPIILVGIENTDRRKDLTGYSESKYDAQFCPLTDDAKHFRAFITKELMPKIATKYRISNQKGIIGESLSGLFVMETFMNHPEMFDFYIAFDPSLWWNDHFLVKNAKNILTKHPNKPAKLWFAGSGAKDIYEHTRALNTILENNAPQHLTWAYSDEPKEHHHTIFRATKEKALIWSLGKNE